MAIVIPLFFVATTVVNKWIQQLQPWSQQRQPVRRNSLLQNMGSLKRAWLTMGDVRIAPVPAYYYAAPHDSRPKSVLGGIGILDNWLVFGVANHPMMLRLPLSALRWASCAVLKDLSLEDGTTTALMLHIERDGRWQIYAFRVPAPLDLANLIYEVAGIPTLREFDLGPAEVVVFRQDIYGRWEKSGHGTAYLAPDRLLIDGRTALHFADLRGIAVSAALGVHQVPNALLRLSYRREDGSLGGLGIQMSRLDAGRWAGAISRRTSIPMQVYEGRKGKAEKQAS
jgi:hypothetical protein